MEIFGTLRIAALVLGSALILANTPAEPPSAQTGNEKLLGQLDQILQAARRDDCATVMKLAPPLIDGPGAASLPGDVQAFLYDVTVQCERSQELKDKAYAHALRGTRLEQSSDWLWRARLYLEAGADKHEAAVVTMEAMSQGRGAALNGVDMNWMWRFETDLGEAGRRDLRKRSLAVLSADSYDPEEVYGPADIFRLPYARVLAQDGDRERARALVVGLKDPSRLAEASLDPRLRVFLPQVDVRAAAEAQLAIHREAMARHPDRLNPIFRAAANLRQLGRPKEALELVQPALARIDEPDAFADREDNLSWWWNDLAETYEMLGRYDEAVAALGKGASASENGNLNVSQFLNLGYMQVFSGHPADALRSMAAFDVPGRRASPYGDMVFRLVRGCALAASGRTAEAAADAAFAKAHEKDHPGALVGLLLCTGDRDGAAAATIRRLADPEHVGEVLLELSDFDDPPVDLHDPWGADNKAMKARPDVKAAIERAGGVRRFRVQDGTL